MWFVCGLWCPKSVPHCHSVIMFVFMTTIPLEEIICSAWNVHWGLRIEKWFKLLFLVWTASQSWVVGWKCKPSLKRNMCKLVILCLGGSHGGVIRLNLCFHKLHHFYDGRIQIRNVTINTEYQAATGQPPHLISLYCTMYIVDWNIKKSCKAEDSHLLIPGIIVPTWQSVII